MKIIYKLDVKFKSNEKYDYIFDSYEAVENWLKKERPSDIDWLKIKTLALCDKCEEYDLIEHYSFIKWDREINTYCMSCSDNYTIDIKKYIRG